MVITRRGQCFINAIAHYDAFESEKAFANMVTIVKLNQPLNAEERNLLYDSYREVLLARRHIIRELLASQAHMLRDQLEQGNNVLVLTEEYQKLELRRTLANNELNDYIREMLTLINLYLLPTAGEEQPEAYVLYTKLLADSQACLAEFSFDDESRGILSISAKSSYLLGINMARKKLSPSNELRLSIILNYAAMQSEIMKDPETAIKVANTAIKDCDYIDMDEIADTEAMRLIDILEKNINMWVDKLIADNKSIENIEEPSEGFF